MQLLDEIGFEQQRLGFGRGGHELHVAVERDHRRDAVGVAADPRVVGNPVLQVARLADIDDVALRIDHAIDARLARQPRNEIADNAGAADLFNSVMPIFYSCPRELWRGPSRNGRRTGTSVRCTDEMITSTLFFFCAIIGSVTNVPYAD